MLHAAEPFLERNLHPTVVIRGYVRALEDAVKIVDGLAFPIDIHDRSQMLKIIASCIGTKFTSRFGTLMPVRSALLVPVHVRSAVVHSSFLCSTDIKSLCIPVRLNGACSTYHIAARGPVRAHTA